jgi:hypothetical protein
MLLTCPLRFSSRHSLPLSDLLGMLIAKKRKKTPMAILGYKKGLARS